MQAVGLTHTGRVRSQNQDAVFYSITPVGALPNLFIVADGMGGHKAGDVASKEAVARFQAILANETSSGEGYVDLLTHAALRVNLELYEMAQANPEMNGMGTTFIACVVENERVDVVHVGDSRAYFISSDSSIEQITRDHTYAEELFRAGEISADEAHHHPKRHHLTRVLGYDPDVVLDGFSRSVAGVRSILLCTDGLTNMVDDAFMAAIVDSASTPAERAARLVDEANAAGGTDNISAVIIDLHGGN